MSYDEYVVCDVSYNSTGRLPARARMGSGKSELGLEGGRVSRSSTVRGAIAGGYLGLLYSTTRL